MSRIQKSLSQPIIRRMREADLEQVARIEAENFSTPWSLASFRDFIDRPDADFLVAVIPAEAADAQTRSGDCDTDGDVCAEQKERILGYIGEYGIPNEGDITNVSVDAACRQQGIGKLLVTSLIDAAAARGITRIFLEVRESNLPAIRLYEGCGFAEVGLRKNYYSNPREHAKIMLRDAESETSPV